MITYDWTVLILAGSSLIFAGIAFWQIMKTKGEVHDLTERGHKLLDSAEKIGKKVTGPAFVADVASRVITGGNEDEAGNPILVTDVVTGYMNAYLPPILDRLEKKVPEWIPIMMNPEMAPTGPQGPQGPQSPASVAGKTLSNQRWQAGLKGAKAAGKVAKATGISDVAGKVKGAVEVVTAVKEMVPAIREIKTEMSGMFGKGKDNGGESGQTMGPVAQAASDWRPPC